LDRHGIANLNGSSPRLRGTHAEVTKDGKQVIQALLTISKPA
jgi:hypothetical protein